MQPHSGHTLPISILSRGDVWDMRYLGAGPPPTVSGAGTLLSKPLTARLSGGGAGAVGGQLRHQPGAACRSLVSYETFVWYDGRNL